MSISNNDDGDDGDDLIVESETEMDFEGEIVKIHRKLDAIMQVQRATRPPTKVKVALIIVLCAAALMIFFGGYAYRSYLG